MGDELVASCSDATDSGQAYETWHATEGTVELMVFPADSEDYHPMVTVLVDELTIESDISTFRMVDFIELEDIEVWEY